MHVEDRRRFTDFSKAEAPFKCPSGLVVGTGGGWLTKHLLSRYTALRGTGRKISKAASGGIIRLRRYGAGSSRSWETTPLMEELAVTSLLYLCAAKARDRAANGQIH